MILVIILIVGACLLVLGVSIWVLIQEIFTVHVPLAITHRVRFHILHYLFQLTLTLGNLLEKMKICSMPRFFRFVQDLLVLKNNHGVLVKDLHFGTIPVRLFQPKAASSGPRRGIVFYHGGGSVFGGLDCYHNICSYLARETDSVLLSVGYRKLPDHHHPSALLDCLNATIHFLKDLKTYGVDPARVVVTGESIGGSGVASITQMLLGRQDLPRFRAQVLIYPVLQEINFQLPSYQQNQNSPFLSRKFMMTCVCKYLAIDLSWIDAMMKGTVIPPDYWKKYNKWLGSDNIPQRFRSQGTQPKFPGIFNETAYLETNNIFNVEVSPLLADDKTFAQLPEAFLVSCEYDILRDDTLLYKKRLEDQGVPVTWCHVEDGFHGSMLLFDKKIFSFPCSHKIMNSTVSYIKGI
ncbi:arylacetamide deacetylase-like 4 [Cricetulus griseus]|uniref:Arylacetamide deacetylase-like 4 n=1 Tax=Cricetulus griseus TaxID=10029 RepID=A0A061IGD5_CRIGR|nr:arylacetamide deacetylase-like 4 [Cricetulus griseus]ERE83537.1 arylacetamide deacetylase-like 4-like protein [Cricetulus griseus]